MDECPSCRRKFHNVYELPLVHISSFERLEVKEPILEFRYILDERTTRRILFWGIDIDNPNVPKEVLGACKYAGGTDCKVGNLVYTRNAEHLHSPYYEVKEDVTDIARLAIDSDQVNGYLLSLEDLVGHEIDPKTLERFRKRDVQGFHRDLCLYLHDINVLGDESVIKVELGTRYQDKISRIAHLALIRYEGRVHPYQPAPMAAMPPAPTSL